MFLSLWFFSLVSLHWHWPPPVGPLPLLLSQEFVCSIFGLVIWLVPILHTFQFTTITATSKLNPLTAILYWGMSDLDDQLHKLGSFLMANSPYPFSFRKFLYEDCLASDTVNSPTGCFFSSLQNPLFWVRTLPFLFLRTIKLLTNHRTNLPCTQAKSQIPIGST